VTLASAHSGAPAPIIWTRAATPAVTAVPAVFWNDPAATLARDGVLLKGSAHHRDTYLLRGAGDAAVLVKHYQLSDLRERLQWRLRRDAPQREWALLQRLAAQAVPVPAPLAVGRQVTRAGVQVWLVVAFIADAVTFDTIHPPREPRALARGARSLARTIAALHAAQVVHRDLHSGNLLYQPRGDTWYITDFQAARAGRISREDLLTDLVQLQHCLGKKVPLAARVVFLRTYLEEFARDTDTLATLTGHEWRWLFADIRRASREYAVVQAHARNRRCLRATRDIAVLHDWLAPAHALPPDCHGLVARDTSRQLAGDLVQLLCAPTWYLAPDVTLLRNTRQHVSAVVTHPQGRVFVKQYRAPATRWQRLRAWLAGPAPTRIWRALWRARHLHLAVPRPCLALWTPAAVFIVTQYVADTLTVETVLTAAPQPAARPAALRLVAREVGLLHDRGAAHGALSLAHVHLRTDGPGAPLLFFSALDRLRFARQILWRARVRDLAALYRASFSLVSDGERRLFLRHYRRLQTTPLNLRQLMLDVLATLRT
jgi:tRNA A-37 threonylcarbamoyl transferase component Bud32